MLPVSYRKNSVGFVGLIYVIIEHSIVQCWVDINELCLYQHLNILIHMRYNSHNSNRVAQMVERDDSNIKVMNSILNRG